MKYGRVDVSAPEECPEEGRLPGERFLAVIYFSFVHHDFLQLSLSCMETTGQDMLNELYPCV